MNLPITTILVLSILLVGFIFIGTFLLHEKYNPQSKIAGKDNHISNGIDKNIANPLIEIKSPKQQTQQQKVDEIHAINVKFQHGEDLKEEQIIQKVHSENVASRQKILQEKSQSILNSQTQPSTTLAPEIINLPPVEKLPDDQIFQKFDEALNSKEIDKLGSKRGLLTCNGQRIDSEIIYWKVVPGDNDYESPITPHHDMHHDRYLTFEYDNGGWNNVRMSLESLIVVAHAMGRTLVVPPQQHLYLIDQLHKDSHDEKPNKDMGFEDFFDIELLRSHQGFHLLHMEEFLGKEGVTGGLKGELPPKNSTEANGQALWRYLTKVADAKPAWTGRYVAFPNSSDDFHLEKSLKDPKTAERMKAFGGERSPVFYELDLQSAHHIHFPGYEGHRVLQHFYAFAFFADPVMQSFYKRFVRDYMRYRDYIQCAGAELVSAVRADSKRIAPENNGDYYALHIRRGDFQFKEVKISAQEIVDNLHFPNGTAIIPPGSVVYVSTDDPDGKCKDCYVQRKPCTSYSTPKPPGCPEDTSWNAFTKAGWKIRFLQDFTQAGYLKSVNPNIYGMIESIVCSRAKAFAGTYFSTFTGYIHRIRGYHGLGEDTYYHHKHYVFYLQKPKSVGHGWSREWRAGWTDDEGRLI